MRSGGKPGEAERAHLRHHHAAVAATGLTGCWSKGWSHVSGGDGEHQRVLDSPLRTAGVLRHRGLAGQRPAVALRSGPQERHAGLPVDSVAAQLRLAAGIVPSARDHRPGEDTAPATEHSGGREHPLCPVDAEGAGSDERPDPSCGHRSDRSDGDGDRAGDCRRRTGPGPSGSPARRAVQEVQPGVCRAPQWQLARGASVQPRVGAEALRHDSTRDCGL